jgi:hypothetical protein
MHSKDPGKRGGALYSVFFLEFKSILATAAKGTADFSKFVFPYLSLRSTDVEVVIESWLVRNDQISRWRLPLRGPNRCA